MLCHITNNNWRGWPLLTRQVVVKLIGSVTTDAGLRIRLDDSAQARARRSSIASGLVRMYKQIVRSFNHAMLTPFRPARALRSAVDREAEQRPDRRQAILLAAEKLFAQRGYHAVTIRQIANEAGVPLALVGYYYGQKHELFEAIFEHWSPTIDERLAGLKAAVDAGGRELLRHIVEAFVHPVLRMRASPEGEFYALLVARELSYASPEADRVLRKHFDPLAHAFIDALQAALPQATHGDVAWTYQFALGALLHHMSDSRVHRLSHGTNTPNDASSHPMLVRFIEAGIRAALPDAPKRRQPSPAP